MRHDTGAARAWATKLYHRITALRPYRAYQRYNTANGGLLAGGIAYTALTSIVAALTLVWSVFMATLGGHAQLREQMVQAVDSFLPGLLENGSGEGLIDPDSLVLDTALTPASVIATLLLVYNAVGIMSNIRSTVQAMFGIVAPPGNAVAIGLRDFVGFFAMATGIAASTVLGTGASTLGGLVFDAIGLGDNPVAAALLRVAGVLVALGVATLTFAFLVRVTAQIRAPRADLWSGSGLGAVAVHIVLFLGTSLVTSVAKNPLLAASASLATLLLFTNILARVLLFVAAFMANPPSPLSPRTPQEVHFDECPNYVTLSAPRTLEWKHQDVSGEIDVDESLRPAHPLSRRERLEEVSDRLRRASR